MKKYYSDTPITVRRTGEMDKMLTYLEIKWLLNPTAVMRHALAIAYQLEINKEKGECYEKN